ncbi:hypothetical protein [Catellatospora sp. NPDC049609]|uniref:hypothetical protein n=1 Tax=Catellatospora sp. NPDC049609 TaxID=3155505 RepID=UPI0034148ED4
MAALVLLASSTVVVADAVAAPPASAAAYCHYNNVAATGAYLPVEKTGSTGDMRYPATLHGATLTLYSHTADASAKVTVDNGRVGDVVSIDRSNYLVTGTGESYFQTTSWVQSHGTGTWDYCEKTLTGTSGSLAGIDGAHRWIRVCLRRSGALQCTNIWYGDNDDETGDSTRIAA